MASRKLLTILALSATVATPAMAQDGGRRRPDNRSNQEQQQTRAPERAERRERAVPRAAPHADSSETLQARPAPRALPVQPSAQARRDNGGSARDYDNRRSNNGRADYNGRYDNGGHDNGRYDNHRPDYYGRAVPRRYTPRIVRPVVVRVVPYRPYVYRPSYSSGVYYGSNGYYPYGYTPHGYFDPIPGRPYGGLRITDAPRYARVFADGYYVGLVNDFDGVFQHLNLEAGRHRIEIENEGYGAIGFDVYIRPGQTITYRAGF